ncbi:MAG: hypothetical protein R3C19_21170 [Planctomycetaceae bacterium]
MRITPIARPVAFAVLLVTILLSSKAAVSEDSKNSAASRVQIDVPEFLPKESRPLAELKIDNGRVFQHNNSLLLVLDQLPENGVQAMPRICNVVESVNWLNGDPEKPLTLIPEITVWNIKLQDVPTGPNRVLVLALDAEPRLFDKTVIASEDSEHVIHLPAKFARTSGEKLRFEPQPHKNTVGYWTVEKDTVEWWFRVDRPGDYVVEIFQGCGKDQGGSDVDVLVGGATLSFVVKDTGHFQNFEWRSLGQVALPKSEKSVLKIVPRHKAVNAVMDVREVRLVPAGK